MKDPRLPKSRELARTLKHISHPFRLLIVCMLSGGELAAGEISARLGTTKGNISQHLGRLAAGGVLARRREGNSVIYRVADRRLVKLLDAMDRLYCPELSLTEKK